MTDPKLPIYEFESLDQLIQYKREWQHRLGLDHWVIHVGFETMMDSLDAGYCKSDYIKHTAIIDIRQPRQPLANMVQAQPDELILVHELLHCVLWWSENPEKFESPIVDMFYHAALEQIAKGLILAKYGLRYDYFTEPERLQIK